MKGITGFVTVVALGLNLTVVALGFTVVATAFDPDDQQRIAYRVDGYEAAKGEAVEDCRMTPKETLWQKLKKHI